MDKCPLYTYSDIVCFTCLFEMMFCMFSCFPAIWFLGFLAVLPGFSASFFFLVFSCATFQSAMSLNDHGSWSEPVSGMLEVFSPPPSQLRLMACKFGLGTLSYPHRSAPFAFSALHSALLSMSLHSSNASPHSMVPCLPGCRTCLICRSPGSCCSSARCRGHCMF